MTENELSKIAIGECIALHRQFEPGLFESVYEEILHFKLKYEQGLKVERQKEIPIFYEEVKMAVEFRADLIVEDKLLIELKSVEKCQKFTKSRFRPI